jgi:dephospho-CoA kinase
MSESDARARMASQAGRDARLSVADLIIVNNGSLDDLHDAVDRIWATITLRSSQQSTE